ncbi:phage tail protein [Leisingera sp. ANG-M7]|uniref:phage tail protein n=1 Tax=Leisingera sp. ANG-M7 TaxID=1577902 RepID=UPI00068B4861|nr:phage tail protein [Leisingera sp. ANG-M7]
MAGLPENPNWEAEIYQIETTDPVVGGPPNLAQGQGIANAAQQQLANRTAWLKAEVEALGLSKADVAELDARISALLNGAPAALDTLKELSDAITGNDDEIAAMVGNIAGKLDASAFTGAAVLALLLAESHPFFRTDTAYQFSNFGGIKRIFAGWTDTGNRFWFAPRRADDSGWDAPAEFGFDRDNDRWYSKAPFSVPSLVGNPTIDRFARLDAKRSGSDYQNAALVLGAPRGDTADGATTQGRGLLAALGKNAGTSAGPVWLASRSSGITEDHTDDDIKGYNGFGIRLDDQAVEFWRNDVLVLRVGNDGSLKLTGQAGAVQSFAMGTPPAGWLECNGAAISRTAYADLFAKIGTLYGAGDGATTFNIPDYRGEFLRGWDNGRGIDGGRAMGSLQDHALQHHGHSYLRPRLSSDTDRGTGGGSLWSIDESETVATGGIDSGNAASETRPRNRAVLYCIKY